MAQKDFKIGALDASNAKIRSNGFFSSLTAKSDLASNVTLVLPDSVGTNGQVLTTDGSGNLSFAASVDSTSVWVDGILNSNSALILESGGGICRLECVSKGGDELESEDNAPTHQL